LAYVINDIFLSSRAFNLQQQFIKMKKLFLFLLLPAASFAQKADKEFKLDGELKLAKPIDWIYLRYNNGEKVITDSFQSASGNFKYEAKIAEPVVATLTVKYAKAEGEEKAGRESVPVFIEPRKLELFAKDSLKALSVKGSAAHADFTALQKAMDPYNQKLIPLYEEYGKLRTAKDKDGMKKLEHIMEEIDNEMKEAVYGAYLKKNPKSAAALYALKQYAGWDMDANKIEPLYAALPTEVKAFPSAASFKEQLAIAKKTAVGQYAMEFTQNDTLDKAVSLSSFKGKYVFVDFCASWCGPCRVENPNIVKAFNRFKDKNFTILGVSLDREGQKEKWMKAIHDDNLTWTHVSDLKFWDNAVAKQYGIRAIPQNLLLDPQGKIIGKNLDGEELEQKLSEVLR